MSCYSFTLYTIYILCIYIFFVISFSYILSRSVPSVVGRVLSRSYCMISTTSGSYHVDVSVAGIFNTTSVLLQCYRKRFFPPMPPDWLVYSGWIWLESFDGDQVHGGNGTFS